MGMIDARTRATLPLIKQKVDDILADKNLRKFMANYHTKIYDALKDFSEFGTYPYMCSLRFVIGDNAPIKDGKYKPNSIDDLARSIDYCTGMEVEYRRQMTLREVTDIMGGVEVNPGEFYTKRQASLDEEARIRDLQAKGVTEYAEPED